MKFLHFLIFLGHFCPPGSGCGSDPRIWLNLQNTAIESCVGSDRIRTQFTSGSAIRIKPGFLDWTPVQDSKSRRPFLRINASIFFSAVYDIEQWQSTLLRRVFEKAYFVFLQAFLKKLTPRVTVKNKRLRNAKSKLRWVSKARKKCPVVRCYVSNFDKIYIPRSLKVYATLDNGVPDPLYWTTGPDH